MEPVIIGSWPELEAPVTALRTAVFIQEQGIPEEEVFDGLDSTALHGILLEEGQAVAAARMREEKPGLWQINWVAAARARRGQGLGETVMRAVLDAVSARGGREAVLEAQSTALGFYEKLGFQRCGEEILFPSGFVLIPMKKDL